MVFKSSVNQGATAGVNSLQSLNGNINLTSTGGSVTITVNGQNINLEAAGGGTVTSVGLTMDGVIFNSTVTGSPITGAGTFVPSLKTQTANVFLAGPTSGGALAPTFRAIVGADLPNPSSSSLGGVQSAAAVSHQWIDSISTLGVPHLSQPAFSDISGLAGLTQGGTNTNLSGTGGAHQVLMQTTLGGNITVAQLAASDLSNGTTGSGGGVVLATGPTLSNPIVGTQAAGDNSTIAASTAFVKAAILNQVNFAVYANYGAF